ncbi:MAG: MarR family transcriptional regulator [Lachnospiraceae bacterium]|nr:MarR family transcriptional regulator [Ruminococcus sp.]MCM1275583.1 MarR family transcriptional regulator [Lachnospiraceae bacterium]
MDVKEVNKYANRYGELRDVQFAAYEIYARKHGLTAKELFVLDIIWFERGGCPQSEICERLSATKQTISAIVKKFLKLGYFSLSESPTDRRNQIIHLTIEGKKYVKKIIPPAAKAENEAMAELSEKDVAELVRLTEMFSENMRKKFNEIGGAKK